MIDYENSESTDKDRGGGCRGPTSRTPVAVVVIVQIIQLLCRGGGRSAAAQAHESLDTYTEIPDAARGHRRSDMYEMT